MKSALLNLFKASLTMLAGWTVAGWLLILLMASLTLISQS